MSHGNSEAKVYEVSAAEALTQCLLHEGIDTVFGVPGGYLSMLLDAFCRAGIRSVEARHEGAAAYMAAGWAQATGKVGVVYGQAGPGVTNLLTGLAAAHMDSTPMLLLAGQAKRDDFGGIGHQEATGYGHSIDQVAVYRTFCRTAMRPPTAATVPRFTRNALTAALRNRDVAVLDLPVDLLSAKIAHDDLQPHQYRAIASRRVDATDVAVIAEMIRAAKRPAILVGNRAMHIGMGDALRTFCEEQQIPVATVSHAKGALPEDHPLSLGVLGRSGQRPALEYFKSADLTLLLGARLSNVVTFGSSTLFNNAVQIDTAEEYIGTPVPVHYGAVADLTAMVQALTHALRGKPSGRALAPVVAEIRAKHRLYATEAACTETDPINPPCAIRVIRENLPREALVVADTGTTALSLGRHFPVYAPDGYFGLYGLASMGSGMPMSMGIALGRPDALVVSVIGDGAFLAHASELGVATQHGIPGIHIVLNNNQYRSVLERQETWFGRVYATRLTNPDYVALARSFGCAGYSVRTASGLAAAVREAVANKKGTTIIEVQVGESFSEEFYAELAEYDKTLFTKPRADWPMPHPGKPSSGEGHQ
jgi:acetolactate synthase-1/2/3 large subunit